MSNPPITVTFPRGWWCSITYALRDAGPEYAALAADLDRAVTAGQVPTEHTTLWDEFDAMVFNLKQQAHAPGVSALEGRTMLTVAGRIEDVLKRYAGSAEGRSVPEISLPTPVTVDQLLAALERVRGEAKETWSHCRPGHEAATWYAVSATAEMLARELVPNRDGAGAPSPAPSEPDVAASPPAPSPTGFNVTLKGGGAGTADGPGEPGFVKIEPAPPAPSSLVRGRCSALHPWMSNVWCTLDVHPGDPAHEAEGTDMYHTAVRWQS